MAKTAELRERVIQAAYTCIARYGIAKTTVDDAAREAGVSRATVYRHFPGGKDQLVAEVVGWEAQRFILRLTALVDQSDDFRSLLVDLLMFTHQAVDQHEVLQKILQTEPERLLPKLSLQDRTLISLIAAFLRPHLDEASVRTDVDRDQASMFLGRAALSLLNAQGVWDLHDRARVEELVDHLLAGILEDDPA